MHRKHHATAAAKSAVVGRVVVAISALLAAATGGLAQAQTAAGTEAIKPAAGSDLHVMVWTATSPGHPTLLLVPTLHRLVADDPRINVALGALADQVQAIVLEAPLTAQPARVAKSLRRYGIYPAGDNITNHVSTMTAARLAQCARQSGQDIFGFFQLKPWLAALSVTFRKKTPDAGEPGGGVPQRLIYAGIDERLSAIAQAKRMPLIYLESIDRGFRLFNDMPPDAQEAVLSATCENLAGVRVPGIGNVTALEAAWLSGDEAQLDRLLTTRDPKESDALYNADQYIFRANTDEFAAALVKYGYFHGKGPILIAVGAGHFFGASSLPDRLRAAGYVITPPQVAAPTTTATAAHDETRQANSIQRLER